MDFTEKLRGLAATMVKTASFVLDWTSKMAWGRRRRRHGLGTQEKEKTWPGDAGEGEDMAWGRRRRRHGLGTQEKTKTWPGDAGEDED